MLVFAAALVAVTAGSWSSYGGDLGGTRHSSLSSVKRTNIGKLAKAWEYHTGALTPATDLNKKAAFECTPILVNGRLYVITPFDQIIALDPVSGAEKWRFDPQVDRTHGYSEAASRGVSAWTDPAASIGTPCRIRIFAGTIDARLLAVDADTGRPCQDFGTSGQVDLTYGIGLRDAGDYQITSAPTIIGNLVITGSSIGDNRAAKLERGTVRAWDARSGALRWSWDPIDLKDSGAANAWSTMSADPERDLIFVPTGSASPDFYGGLRPGDNAHADSVTALRASTGELVWSYQVVHHDLWDYDVAAQPALLTFKGRPAVAVATKMGLLFVLDRETGKPLNEVVEKPVPNSDVPGEHTSPTQPIPTWDALVPLGLKPEDVWGATPEMRQWCSDQLTNVRNEGFYTPPSVRGTLVFPGNAGGVNWGSLAVDTRHGIIYADTNRMAGIIRLIPRDEFTNEIHKAEIQAKTNRFTGEFGRQAGTPYALYRNWFLAPGPVPCNRPPWGALVAFDLATGKVKWEAPLGSMIPGANTGTPNLGGPLVTDGGLVFTAASMDTYLRAFDSQTGKEIWKAELPASAQSTPMTYQLGGKQYIVICAGGHGKLGTKMGDSVIAFSIE